MSNDHLQGHRMDETHEHHHHGHDHGHDHGHEGAHDAECAAAIAELYAYLDRECDQVTVERIEVHLRRCSPCLEAFDFEAELKRAVAGRCSEPMPETVRAKLVGLLGSLATSPVEPSSGAPTDVSVEAD